MVQKLHTMNKFIISFVLLISIYPSLTFGQVVFNITQDSIRTCEGLFFDSGGENGNYTSNENEVITICADGFGLSHMQISFQEIDLADGDQIILYDGPDTNSPTFIQDDIQFDRGSVFQATAENTSGCITVQFISNGGIEDMGWIATVSCVKSCQPINPILTSSDPPIVPVDTGYIDLCPGQEVQLSATAEYPQNGIFYAQSDALSIFEWDFGDGTKLTGQDVTHSYQESGGFIVQLTITDTIGCTNTQFISQRVRVSPQPEFEFDFGEGNDGMLCFGDTLETRLTAIEPVEATFSTGKVFSDTLFLPDGDGTFYETSLEFNQFNPGQTLIDPMDLESICVNMEHSWLRDLEIEIFCPNGQSAILHDFFQETGTGISLGEPVDFDEPPRPGNGFDYCWTLSATRGTFLGFANDSLVNGQTLPEGDYNPFESFNNLVGCPLNGVWSLRIQDLWEFDNGYIFSWDINFNPDIFPVVETFTPTIDDYRFTSTIEPYLFSPDSLFAVVQTSGQIQQVFTVTDNFNCSFDTTIVFESLPPTHPDCINCVENLIEVRDTTICEGAQLSVLAEPRLISGDLTFPFETPANIDFGKRSFARNTELLIPINVSSIFPEQISDANQDIISICIDAEIAASDPFSIALESPNGDRITLVQEGITGSFQNVCFTPDATTLISAGTSPFNGNFLPVDPFDDLNGTNTQGNWNLIITSLTGDIEAGEITSWSIEFQGQNQLTYNWSPSDGLSCTDCPDPIIQTEESRTYFLEVTNSFDCVYLDTITVNIDPDLTTLTIDRVDATPVSCFGENTGSAEVFANGGNGTYSYVWSDSLSQISPTAVFLETGTYGVTVSDEDGCRVSSETIITQPDSLILSSTVVDAFCRGESSGSIELSGNGGVSPYSATWADGSTAGLSRNGIPAGTYMVTLNDDNGCTANAEIVVGEPPTGISSEILQTVQGCFGQSQNQLMVNAQGGFGTNYQFEWSNGQTTSTATNLDTISYTVTITDENGCQITDSFAPVDLLPIDFEIIQSRPTCPGFTDGRLGVTNLSGGAGTADSDYTIQWGNNTVGEFIENLAGGQIYAVTVTDNQGCFTAKERLLDDAVQLDFNVTTSPVTCFGFSNGSAEVIDLPGDISTYTFDWGANSGNQTTSTADQLAAGAYTLLLNDGGCTYARSVVIEEPTAINIAFSTTDNVCFGDAQGTINTTISGGTPQYRISWSNGGSTSNLDGLLAGTYTATVVDGNGCILENQVSIEQPSDILLTLDGIDPSCFGDRDGTISVTAEGGTPPYQYSLNGSDFSPSNQILGLEANDYNIFVRDNNNCVVNDVFSLDNPIEFMVDAGPPEIEIILGDSVDLTARPSNSRGNITYSWGAPYTGTLNCDTCQIVTALPTSSITYQLTAVDGLGCIARDLVSIVVQKFRGIDVPTGFTPNGDTNNDRLLVHGRSGTMVKIFRVYNRWGELLYEDGGFEVNTRDIGWDGSFKGKPVNSDTYIWYVEVEYIDGTTDSFRGQTNLIR